MQLGAYQRGQHPQVGLPCVVGGLGMAEMDRRARLGLYSADSCCGGVVCGGSSWNGCFA
jgi:hypothetical protein